MNNPLAPKRTERQTLASSLRAPQVVIEPEPAQEPAPVQSSPSATEPTTSAPAKRGRPVGAGKKASAAPTPRRRNAPVATMTVSLRLPVTIVDEDLFTLAQTESRRRRVMLTTSRIAAELIQAALRLPKAELQALLEANLAEQAQDDGANTGAGEG